MLALNLPHFRLQFLGENDTFFSFKEKKQKTMVWNLATFLFYAQLIVCRQKKL